MLCHSLTLVCKSEWSLCWTDWLIIFFRLLMAHLINSELFTFSECQEICETCSLLSEKSWNVQPPAQKVKEIPLIMRHWKCSKPSTEVESHICHKHLGAWLCRCFHTDKHGATSGVSLPHRRVSQSAWPPMCLPLVSLCEASKQRLLPGNWD